MFVLGGVLVTDESTDGSSTTSFVDTLGKYDWQSTVDEAERVVSHAVLGRLVKDASGGMDPPATAARDSSEVFRERSGVDPLRRRSTGIKEGE